MSYFVLSNIPILSCSILYLLWSSFDGCIPGKVLIEIFNFKCYDTYSFLFLYCKCLCIILI